MKKLTFILGLTVMSLLMNACKKDAATTQTYPYSVRMTDAPGPYTAVYIDLQGVEITGGDGKAVILNVNKGIYNLLRFSNGLDTLIASGTLLNANVEQVRLILGTNNSVVVGGVSHPLSTPSAEQSGLKLQVHQTLQAEQLSTVLLDFDANKSIIQEGNGTYKLKPVLRTIVAADCGLIRGKITPAGVVAFVEATSSITYSSNITASGDFLLMGLPPGTYSVTVTPLLPLLPITVNNITVTKGVTTDIGVIVF